MTGQERELRLTRRRMLWRSAVAAGVGEGGSFGIGVGPGRGGGGVRYGQINKYSAPSDLRITDMRAASPKRARSWPWPKRTLCR